MAQSGGEVEDGKYWYWCMIDCALDDSPHAIAMLNRFSRLASGEPQLACHAGALQMFGASLELVSERVKNNERAQEYRNNGNDLFSSNENPAKVAEMYTKSIAYASPGSRELALAYANRSAVSFETGNYEDCLGDIKRSLANDYPNEMKAKLYARSVRCLVALGKPQSEIDEALENTREALSKMDQRTSGRGLVEKTLTDKNHMAPTTPTKKTVEKLKPTIEDDSCDIRGATGVTIQYSEEYGRHIVATRDIRPGEIIAAIDNYATARNPENCYRECAHCTEATTVGIPCDHCVNVTYCSTSCRYEAWTNYHEFECPILGMMLDLELPGFAILGVKMTLKAVKEAGGINELKEMLKNIDSISDPRVKGFTGDVLDCSKYACIYTLASHAGKHSDHSYLMSLTSTFTIYYLATRTEIFGQKYHADVQVFDKNPLLGFLGGVMIRNLEIVKITASGVNATDNPCIAPFTALCNHSCDSNVISFGNPKSIAFALQPIKAGEQIWDNYEGLHYSSSPRDKRQQSLKEHYLFTCDCVACSKNWPMLQDLPSFFDMEELSPTIRTRLSELERIFSEKYNLSLSSGDVLAVKEDLIELIELLSEYACPCKEIITYRLFLKNMYGRAYDFM